jgi:hypothetical protein
LWRTGIDCINLKEAKMFCIHCGNSVEGEALAVCAQCGQVTQPAFSAADAGRIIKSAAADAIVVMRRIAIDPVAGLPASFVTLGERRARSAGVAFGVTFALAAGIATAVAASGAGFGNTFKLMLAMFVVALAPFAAMAAVSTGVRKAFRTAGTAGADLLSCGVALQPFGVFFILAAVLGIGNLQTVALLSLFAWTYALTILFTGCTQLVRIPERLAPPVMAVMLLVAIWSTRLVGGWLLESTPFGRFFGG